MESLTNVTFNEIKVGDTATVSRRLSRTEVEALALVGGDVDPFHIAEGEGAQSNDWQTEAVGAEAPPRHQGARIERSAGTAAGLGGGLRTMLQHAGFVIGCRRQCRIAYARH